MKCPKCESELSDDSKFCPNCGSIVEIQGKTCPNPECGRTGLPQDAVYCPDCGTKFNLEKNKIIDDTSKQINIYIENISIKDRILPVVFLSLMLVFLYLVRFMNEDDNDMYYPVVIPFGILFIIPLVYHIIYIINHIYECNEYIKLNELEQILMMKKLNGIGSIYLTNERFLFKKWNKIVWEYNLRSKEIIFDLWTTSNGKQKGIKINQKYEDTRKIELNKPQKWYDKIIEITSLNIEI